MARALIGQSLHNPIRDRPQTWHCDIRNVIASISFLLAVMSTYMCCILRLIYLSTRYNQRYKKPLAVRPTSTHSPFHQLADSSSMRVYNIIPALLFFASSALAATTPGLSPRICTSDGLCETSIDRRCCLATWLCSCPDVEGEYLKRFVCADKFHRLEAKHGAYKQSTPQSRSTEPVLAHNLRQVVLRRTALESSAKPESQLRRNPVAQKIPVRALVRRSVSWLLR